MIKKILKAAAIFVSFTIIAGLSAYLTITLIIKSEDTVIIPELKGKDVIYALEILSGLGLNTKVNGSEYSSDVPKNHIIYQEPDPGTEIKIGRDVRVIISKGKKTVAMPNLKGLSIQRARLILEENDIGLKTMSATYSDMYRKDDVIAQIPSSGSKIRRNSIANLLVSLGQRPRAYKMPDLTGMSLNEAIMFIENNNLLPGEIKSISNENSPENVIVEQEPVSGRRVIGNSSVNLVINRTRDEKRRGFLQGSSGIRLMRYRTENGLLKRHIIARLNCFGISNDIFDGMMKPGTEIWLLIPNNMDAAVFIYENEHLIKTRVFDAW